MLLFNDKGHNIYFGLLELIIDTDPHVFLLNAHMGYHLSLHKNADSDFTLLPWRNPVLVRGCGCT